MQLRGFVSLNNSENEANRRTVNGRGLRRVILSRNGNGIAGCELRVIPLIRGGRGEHWKRFASNVPVTLFQRADAFRLNVGQITLRVRGARRNPGERTLKLRQRDISESISGRL